MRAIGKRIQEKIGQAMPREVLGKLHVRRKNQPLPIDGPRFSFTAQIAFCIGVVFEQPEHAAVDILKQAHPDVEDLRRDLADVVEATKHEDLGGQTRLGAAGRHVRNSSF